MPTLKKANLVEAFASFDETRSLRVGGDINEFQIKLAVGGDINEFQIKLASSRACVDGTGL